MKLFVRQLVTGPDDKADEQALISILAFLVLCWLEIYEVIWLHQPFDMQSFGIAVGGIGFQRGCAAYANRRETP